MLGSSSQIPELEGFFNIAQSEIKMQNAVKCHLTQKHYKTLVKKVATGQGRNENIMKAENLASSGERVARERLPPWIQNLISYSGRWGSASQGGTSQGGRPLRPWEVYAWCRSGVGVSEGHVHGLQGLL